MKLSNSIIGFSMLFILLTGTERLAAQTLSFSTIFPEDSLHQVELFLDIKDWRHALDATGTFEEASLKVNSGKSIDVQIARKGNTANSNTRARDKFPIKVDGPGGFNFKLNNNYRDYTMGAREHIAYKLHREFTGIGSKTAPAELFVNGEFYGFFLVVEDLNETFYNEKIGPISDRVKASPTDLGIYKNYHCDLFWLGDDIEDYKDRYEIKKGSLNDLVELIDIINNKPDEAYKVLDIDQICRFLAVENYLINTDGIIGEVFSHNYELVKREKDGKWQIIPWDLNMCLGGWSSPSLSPDEGIIDQVTKLALNVGRDNNALVELILQKYFFLYNYYYAQVVAAYPAEKLISWAELFRQVLMKSPYVDQKLYEVELFEKAYTEDLNSLDGFVTGLYPTIEKRYKFLKKLKLTDRFAGKISDIQPWRDSLFIFPSIDLGDAPVVVEYLTTDEEFKKLRAHRRAGDKKGYYCILPSDVIAFYVYTIYQGIKYDYPIKGRLEPINLNTLNAGEPMN